MEENVLEYHWKEKNDLLISSIELNQQHLVFCKRKIEKLKRAIVAHIVLFVICFVVNVVLWRIKVIFWGDDQPTIIGVGLFSTAVLVLFDFLLSIRSIKYYIYHVVKDFGWTKPQAVDKNTKIKSTREKNFKAEYEKVSWILRQYENEKEQMYSIKMKIDSGEIYNTDDLIRQLHEILIYEDVAPAMK